MIILFISIIMFCAVLLIGLVLLQKSKNDGGNPIDSAGTAQLFGVTKGSDLLESMTWILASIIVTLSMVVSIRLIQQLKNSQNYLSPNVEAVLDNEALSLSVEQNKKEISDNQPKTPTNSQS